MYHDRPYRWRETRRSSKRPSIRSVKKRDKCRFRQNKNNVFTIAAPPELTVDDDQGHHLHQLLRIAPLPPAEVLERVRAEQERKLWSQKRETDIERGTKDESLLPPVQGEKMAPVFVYKARTHPVEFLVKPHTSRKPIVFSRCGESEGNERHQDKEQRSLLPPLPAMTRSCFHLHRSQL